MDKRKRSSTCGPIAAAEPLAKSFPSFPPKRFAEINVRIMEFVLYAMILTKCNTSLARESVFRRGKGPAKLDPSIVDINGREWNLNLPEAQEHITLACIGDENNIAPMCRVTASSGDPETLWVCFRPFMLHAMQSASWVKLVMSYVFAKGSVRQSNSSEMIMAKIFAALVTKTCVKNPDSPFFGVSDGYRTLLDAETEVWFENVLSRIPSAAGDDRAARFAREWPGSWMPDSAVENKILPAIEGTRTKVPSAVGFLARFIAAYRPARVVFTGFSLGGGSSLAAAIACKRMISNSNSNSGSRIRFYSLSVAGTMACNASAAEYAEKNFESCIYLRSRIDKATDPVSFLPYAQGYVHAGTVVDFDFKEKSFRVANAGTNNGRKNARNPFTMSAMLTSGFGLRDVGFRTLHLPAEDMTILCLLYNLLSRGYNGGMVNGLQCEFFASMGTASKYGVCPRGRCVMLTKGERSECGCDESKTSKNTKNVKNVDWNAKNVKNDGVIKKGGRNKVNDNNAAGPRKKARTI